MPLNKDDKRPISFSTKFTVLRGDKPLFLLGIIFTVVSIFILTPMLTGITISTKAPYEKYDFKAIEKYGIETTATVTNIEVLYNTIINGEHPKVISYKYYNNGRSYSDQFKTLTSYNNVPINVNDAVKVKVYNNQSIIEDLKPFRFPYYIFYFLPLVFLMVGIPFIAAGLFPALKKLNLYKYGTVKEATITAMQPIMPRGKNQFSPYILVDYFFTSITGQKIYGKSTTHNMHILTTKKLNDKIKIFVSEENEKASCLVPMDVAEKNGWAV